MKSTETPKIDSFPHRITENVRFRDLDPLGHVNNAVFSTYLEAGRIALLTGLQSDVFSIDSEATFVIARLVVEFRNEITWPGEIQIGSGIQRIGSTSCTVEQGLFQNGRWAAHAESVIVQIDAQTRKPKRLDAPMVERLTTLTIPRADDAAT